VSEVAMAQKPKYQFTETAVCMGICRPRKMDLRPPYADRIS
jgi:hypothetical protein